jgi:hypothetical protein
MTQNCIEAKNFHLKTAHGQRTLFLHPVNCFPRNVFPIPNQFAFVSVERRSKLREIAADVLAHPHSVSVIYFLVIFHKSQGSRFTPLGNR